MKIAVAAGLALAAATPAVATLPLISCILGELPIIGSLFPCIDVLNNVDHCGSLQYSCPSDLFGIRWCSQGSCGISCDTGYGWCNENKCTNLATDPANCGKVGNVCPSTSNGSPTCSSGVCGIQCATGYALSNGQCVSLSTSPSNCGSVGKVCPSPSNGKGVCTSGSCSVQCNPNYGLLNGACVGTTGDASNCGSVGTVCPAPAHGTAVCANSQCSVACNTGYALSGNTCVDITTISNCGSVGAACGGIGNGTAICTSGNCGYQCNYGFALNNGLCVDIETDPNNCGSINHVCSSVVGGTVGCSNGACTLSCLANYQQSGNTCVAIPVTTITITSIATATATTTKTKTTKTKTSTSTSSSASTSTASSSYPNPTSCPDGTARHQWGLYPGYQTTMNGLPATSASSVEDCAAQCYALSNCASFDFWFEGSQGLCGIQTGGTGFDGFSALAGVIHAVPGPCSSQVNLCPASAVSDCQDLAECIAVTPATTPGSDYAVYNGYQSTAAGLDAVSAASVEACASICGANSECKSFDFWLDGSNGQCGIQVVGGGFDGFQAAAGVHHGLPGTCAGEASLCPISGASCQDVTISPSSTKPFALFQGYQSTADGLDAVSASSADECASLCAANSACKSFDFWLDGSAGQCGIQVVGNGFDGFQADEGVVHGVPGTCADEASTCPISGAACEDASVTPATTSTRHRFVRRSLKHRGSF